MSAHSRLLPTLFSRLSSASLVALPRCRLVPSCAASHSHLLTQQTVSSSFSRPTHGSMIAYMLMVNLLIALFSRSFDLLAESAVANYQLLRSQSLVNWFHQPPAPPPLRLLRLPYEIGCFFASGCYFVHRRRNDFSAPSEGAHEGEADQRTSSPQVGSVDASVTSRWSSAKTLCVAPNSDAHSADAAITDAPSADTPSTDGAKAIGSNSNGRFGMHQKKKSIRVHHAGSDDKDPQLHPSDFAELKSTLFSNCIEYIAAREDDAAAEDRWRVMLTKSITRKLRRHKDDLQVEIRALEEKMKVLASDVHVHKGSAGRQRVEAPSSVVPLDQTVPIAVAPAKLDTVVEL